MRNPCPHRTAILGAYFRRRGGQDLTYGGYFIGSKRLEEQLQTVKVEPLEVRRARERACKQTRVDDIAEPHS